LIDSPLPDSAAVREERWKAEARFFDEQSDKIHIAPIDPLTLARYRPPHRLRFNKEFRLHVLGGLQGKRVLDVGCGEGTNAILLAKLGGAVVGIDISPNSIEIAGQRGRVNGLGDRVQFLCSPLETAPLPPASFDIIWGEAILHHVIAELDTVMKKLAEVAKPGAIVLFSEPVNFNRTLRRIRFLIPVHTDATPDERPLEPAEMILLRAYVPDLRSRMFTLFGRLDRFLLPDYNYERSSLWRRAVSGAIATLDYMLLSLPGIRRLAGTAVLYGHIRHR